MNTRIQVGGEKLVISDDISFSTSTDMKAVCRPRSTTLLDEIAFVDEETTAGPFPRRTERGKFFLSPSSKQRRSIIQIFES